MVRPYAWFMCCLAADALLVLADREPVFVQYGPWLVLIVAHGDKP